MFNLDIKNLTLKDQDLEKFTNGKKIPKRELCNKALSLFDINSKINPAGKDPQGGNGIVCLTTDGKYAVKRSTDENDVHQVQKAISKINANNPRGFKFNLPSKLLVITDHEGKAIGPTIQIGPKAVAINESADWGHLNIGDIGSVVRRYFSTKDDLCLKIIHSLGQKLAEFQNTKPFTKDAKGFHVGLQHGDFNAGNIFVDSLNKNGKATFSVIDNVDFNPEGRILADPVYFTYFNTIVVPGLDATDDHKNKMNEIVKNFYAGYVSKLDKKACEDMKPIFSSATPLRSNIGKYKGLVIVKDRGPWDTILDKMQKEAFKQAFDKKFPSDKKVHIKVQEPTAPSSKTDIHQIYANASKYIPQNQKVAAPKGWLPPQPDAGITKIDLRAYGKDLKHIDELSKLSNLKEINLSGTSVEDLSPLRNLQKLEKLNLSHNRALSAVEPLKNIKSLKSIDLSHTNVVWVGPLGDLPHLESLNLSHTPVNKVESEMEKVQNLPKLKNLNLQHTALNQ